MKTLTTLLVVTILIIQISGYLIQVPTAPISVPTPDTVSAQWLHIQKLMIPLFENVCETSNNPIIRRLSQEFTMGSGEYLKPEAISNLQQLISVGSLPKGDIFTEYNPDHMKELKIIYEVLHQAKNFDAFFKAAAWARQNLNCAVYVNALYMALQNRRDMERLSIPAPYELLPNYFVRKDVIVLASSILAGQEITNSEGIRDEGNTYHLDANYTALFYDNDDESKLAYFREDIGLNSYYFLRKLRLAPWFNDDINSRYGENMYQMMKQFMARYNLERYANGLPEIDGINWSALPDISYDPMLIYSDGNEFGHRLSSSHFPVNEDLALLETIENNVAAVVSHLRQSGYNKTQILNHLMEILVTGDRSYETLARQLLGKDFSNNGHASVLEHYMTSLRDPMFWKINKKIVDLVDSALKILPSYSRNELYFPGVEVVNIDVKKMLTAYEYFEFDVTDALKIEDSNSTFNIKIGQPRLNHKPFTIKVNISSIISKKGLLKIYLGPKLMPGELATKKNLFTLLDMFEINLKVGTNIITRTSNDMRHFSSDFMSLQTIRTKVEDAEFGLDSFLLKTIESQTGYPSRLILPKGSPQGLPIQIFVFVAPYFKASLGDSYSTNSMDFNSAILSPGYPLDLNIEDRQLFALPNAMIKYVAITQKGDSKVENYGGPGVTKQWYGTNSYDPSSRPTYDGKNKEPFDYTSKQKPYEISDSNFAKINEVNVVSQNSIAFDEENQDEDYDGIPKLLKSTKFDYSLKTKAKEPFKPTAKKEEQFAEKQYSSEKDDIKYSKVLPLYEKNLSNKETQNINMNVPRSLRSSKIDYSSKFSKKPFEYKPQKAQLEKGENLIKTESYSIFPTTMPLEIVYENNQNDLLAPLLSSKLDKKDFTLHDITISTPKENVVIDKENQENNMIMTPRLLKSAKFDYTSNSKRKEPFDYKAKKAQFDKKDYSAKRGDYTKYRTLPPKEEEVTTVSAIVTTEFTNEFTRVELDKDTTNVDLVNEIMENNLKNYDNLQINDDDMNGEVEPFVLSNMVKKRTPTVYDFLFHTFDYEDSPEIKVYE